MTRIGLTGGIGMGKSTAAEWFAQQGIPVIDTDTIARELVEPGKPALQEIASAFGDDLIETSGANASSLSSGRLRRDELARRVFASTVDRQKLETILHPRIREQWLAEIARLRTQGAKACVVVIPLLFETGAEPEFDAIICVACSHLTQRSRLLARGWTDSHIDQRIGSQWPTEKKMTSSNYVVWSEGSIELHHEQLGRVLRDLAHPR